MITYLVILLCAGQVCEERRIPLYNATATQCVMTAPFVLSDARIIPPGLKVQRWHCVEEHEG